MIYLSGDLHGEIDIERFSTKKWAVGKSLTKDDYLVIAGDFGLVYGSDAKKRREEEYWLDWLEKKPWTTLFIDGNHENFPMLRSYPEEERFGGPVGVLRPSVMHLKRRGHIYNIGGHDFWCFGGATSYDKKDRIMGKSWWKEEEPTFDEIEYGLERLEKKNYSVGFILTHDCPGQVLPLLPAEKNIDNEDKLEQPTLTQKYFNEVAKLLKSCRKWYFGHYHMDKHLPAVSVDGGARIDYQAMYLDKYELLR